jgi:pimeloyl-ACP methyl ester carboxylesterase
VLRRPVELAEAMGQTPGKFERIGRRRSAWCTKAQVPWGEEALNGMISEPAWKTRPSWYFVATDDKMIPPSAQYFMARRAKSTVVEAGGSHAIYMSQPHAVAALIEQAVRGVQVRPLGALTAT